MERRKFKQKTILLCYEGGLGDTLQFLCFVPRFVELRGKVTLQCQPILKSLLLQQKKLKVDNILDELDFSPNYDFTLSLMSLPAPLHVTSKEEIIIGRPYIEVLYIPTPHIKNTQNLKVGLVWAGNPSHRNDQFRSISVHSFAVGLTL